MVTNVSKTYSFNPPLGELILVAFGRAQIRPTEITQQHMYQARLGANFLLSEWSNSTPMLWEVALQTIPLLEGSATYTAPAETVMILDTYVSYGSPTTDRFIYPLSRTEYAALPDKTTQSFPNQYWFNRLISPTITLYPVPDGNGPYVLKYYSVRQTMDAVVAGGLNVEVPYRFLDAFVAGLAWKMAEVFRPELEDKLFTRYMRSFTIATTQDVENVPLAIIPGLGGYFR